MRPSKHLNLTEFFKKSVYEKYFDGNCDATKGIELVDKFLNDHPHYAEALLFKGRMLIVNEEYEEALKYLEAAKNADQWRVAYAFDIAEIYLKTKQKNKAVKMIEFAIQSLLDEITNGMSDLLLSVDIDYSQEIKDIMKSKITSYITGELDSIEFDELHKILPDTWGNNGDSH